MAPIVNMQDADCTQARVSPVAEDSLLQRLVRMAEQVTVIMQRCKALAGPVEQVVKCGPGQSQGQAPVQPIVRELHSRVAEIEDMLRAVDEQTARLLNAL